MDVFDLKATLSLDSSKFNSGLDKAKGLASSFGGMVGGALSTVAKVGAAALGAATTAVTAFGVSSVKTGMSFDKSMSQVAATMGKTVEQLEGQTGRASTSFGEFNGNLRDFAKFMGKNTQYTASQAADALNYMALAGYNVQQSMDMLPNVLSLAAAGDMDLARASDMVTDAQTAFGIDAARTTQMVNEMAKAASTGNTSVSQLGDAFLVVGGLAKELNGGMVKLKDGTTKSVDGVQELEIALTAMANAGVKGSEAGTHMRNMLLKLSSPTKEGTKALEKMGVKVFDAEGKMRSLSSVFGDLNTKLNEMTQEQRIGVISELFNTRDMASAEALLSAVSQDWDRIGESILNAKGAADKMAETQLDNLAGDIEKFKSALEGAKIALSDNLSPSLRTFVQMGTEGVSALATLFETFDASGVTDEMGRVTDEAGAMFVQKREEAISTIFGTIEGIINAIASGIPDAIEAGGRLLGAIATGIFNNIGAITTAAADVIVKLVLGLVEALPTLVNGAAQLINGLVQGFSAHSSELIAAGKQLLDMVYNGIIQNAGKVIEGAADVIKRFLEGITQNAKSITEGAKNIIMELISGLKAAIPELIPAAFEAVKSLAVGLGEAAPELIPAAVELVLELVVGILDNVDKLVDGAVALVTGLGEGIINSLPILLEKAPEIVAKLVVAIVEAAPKLLEAATTLIAQLAVGLVEGAPKIMETAVTLVQSLILGIVSLYQSVTQAGADLVTKILEGLESVGFDAFQWGLDMILGIVDGIKNGFSALGDAVGGAAGIIKSFLHFSVPDEGPLADADQYMPDMMNQFAEGITANGQQMVTALVTVLTNVQTNIITFCTNAIQNITTTLTNILTTVADYCLQFIDTANRTLSDILNKVITWMSQIPPKMIYYITSAVNGFMNMLNTLPGKVASVLQNVLNKVIEWGANLVNKAIEIARNFADALINGIRDLPSKFAEVGSNIVQGLWNGISSGWDWLTSQVAELANSLLEAAKDALDIESPSKKFYWIGQMVDEGFAKGLGDNSYRIDRAMSDILDVTENVPTPSSSSGANGARGGFTQVVNITSPVALTPYEVARQTRNATRDLVLAMSGV
jgi:TP901 family phage tail tape measure protein